MPKFRVTGVVTASKDMGEFKANSAREAEDMVAGSEEAWVSVCHQ